MIVKLKDLDFRHTMELIDYCLVNQVDYERALELRFAWLEQPPHRNEYVWELDIPDELFTYFLLKWNEE